jgi:hypothetical protein
MGTGSGVYGFNSRIASNSYSYMSQREFAFPNVNRRPQGSAFYGLSKPQYQSTMYYTLSNNNSSAGARMIRGGYPAPRFI